MTTLTERAASTALTVFFDDGNPSAGTPAICTEKLAHDFCLAALQAQDKLDIRLASEVELSVQLVPRDDMQALNLRYRQKDSPTNILSFESGLPVMSLPDDNSAGGMLALGDLVLCPDIIVDEAREQSKPEAEHWAHLLVHGTLHLCGYDHEDAQQAQTMESLEIQILSKAGIADPYGTRE